jgi:hypothetical protein
MPEETTKLFISYSWSSPEHEQWVLRLATELRESGVDVILDKWDLKEGHDSYAFMEKMATDPDIKKVALICDRLYAEKADGRSGGVGTETQIISPEIYKRGDQDKFVAVVAQKDESGKAYLPTYYKSRIYIDLSDPEIYARNFEQLLRWIFNKPLYLKPDLGNKPAFLSDAESVSLGTTPSFRRAVEAVRNSREHSSGALSEYFSTFTQNLERFRLSNGEGNFDDKVVNSIEQFIPYRSEAIEIILALAQYRDTPDTYLQLHRFFENLIPYLDKPENVTQWKDVDNDNYKFIIHELFLYAVAALLKYERFEAASYLLRNHYYVESRSQYGSDNMVPFAELWKPTRSLAYRNERLNLRRLSLRADFLEKRSKTSGIPFRQLAQADFILYIRNVLESLRSNDYRGRWWPETLLYVQHYWGSFEIFSRAQSAAYFDKVKRLFDIQTKQELEQMMQAFREGKISIPQWQFETFSPDALMGYSKLATRP